MRVLLRRLKNKMPSGVIMGSAGLIYIAGSAILTISLAIFLFSLYKFPILETATEAVFLYQIWLGILLFWAVLSIPLTIMLMIKSNLWQKHHFEEIGSHLHKLGQGHLGWKIELKGGSEISELAQSASEASFNLAQKIEKIQDQSRAVFEIEDLFIDMLRSEGRLSPLSTRALRKLKIHTSRLKNEIEAFQFSTLATPDE